MVRAVGLLMTVVSEDCVAAEVVYESEFVNLEKFSDLKLRVTGFHKYINLVPLFYAKYMYNHTPTIVSNTSITTIPSHYHHHTKCIINHVPQHDKLYY